MPVPRAQALCPLWGEGLREAEPLPTLTPQRVDPPPSDLGTDTKEKQKKWLAQKVRESFLELGVRN